jgi:hypothetical protein
VKYPFARSHLLVVSMASSMDCCGDHPSNARAFSVEKRARLTT